MLIHLWFSLKFPAFVVATGLIVFFGVVAFIKFLLIKGTAHVIFCQLMNKKSILLIINFQANPTQIFPAVILEAVVLTFEMLACLGSLFYFELNSLLMYAFSAIVNSYCLICLYSLYEKTRSAANLRLANAQP